MWQADPINYNKDNSILINMYGIIHPNEKDKTKTESSAIKITMVMESVLKTKVQT